MLSWLMAARSCVNVMCYNLVKNQGSRQLKDACQGSSQAKVEKAAVSLIFSRVNI